MAWKVTSVSIVLVLILCNQVCLWAETSCMMHMIEGFLMVFGWECLYEVNKDCVREHHLPSPFHVFKSIHHSAWNHDCPITLPLTTWLLDWWATSNFLTLPTHPYNLCITEPPLSQPIHVHNQRWIDIEPLKELVNFFCCFQGISQMYYKHLAWLWGSWISHIELKPYMYFHPHSQNLIHAFLAQWLSHLSQFWLISPHIPPHYLTPTLPKLDVCVSNDYLSLLIVSWSL